jgi:hypothetical protein
MAVLLVCNQCGYTRLVPVFVVSSGLVYAAILCNCYKSDWTICEQREVQSENR